MQEPAAAAAAAAPQHTALLGALRSPPQRFRAHPPPSDESPSHMMLGRALPPGAAPLRAGMSAVAEGSLVNRDMGTAAGLSSRSGGGGGGGGGAMAAAEQQHPGPFGLRAMGPPSGINNNRDSLRPAYMRRLNPAMFPRHLRQHAVGGGLEAHRYVESRVFVCVCVRGGKE